MDLFQAVDIKSLPGTPLPEKIRPKTINDFVGQKNNLLQLQRYLKSGFYPSLILWGPPGTGKTSFAKIISQHFECDFIAINATQSGAKELREIGESGKRRRLEYHRRSTCFIDEVHRLNKAQQDVLLPYLESGDLTLIGATTENPSYELNKAILSRCRLLIFEKMQSADMQILLCKGLKEQNIDSSNLQSIFEPSALAWFLQWADGDARRMLLALEEVLAEFKIHRQVLTKSALAELLGQMVIGHDKASDSHYDLISAMIKAIRGSDADAGLYYLARLLKGGEDPLFIARRLVILASEDVGNADPRGVQMAVACAQAIEMVGLPEAGINLAHAVTYLSSAPKSNRSYVAYKKALQLVEETGSVPIPNMLRSAQTASMKDIGYGQGYLYPHDYARHWIQQNYLPPEIQISEKIYQPASIGFEKQIQDFQAWLRAENNPPKKDQELTNT